MLSLSLALALLSLLLSTFIGPCQSQEAPAFSTGKFDFSKDHRTDLCARHRQVYLDEISLPDALAGLNLSVVLTDYDDPVDALFFSLNEAGVIDTQVTPLFATIMDELAERAGFFWRNSFGVVKPITSADTNRTWSDLLEWEVQTYDVAMGKWDRTASRIANKIAFPIGWYDSSIILVQSVQDDGDSLNIWSFLLPFEMGVWGLILAAIVVSGLLYFLLERMDTAADEQDLERHPSAAVYYSFINFTGQNEFQPQTNAARLLTFSMAFWALIIGAAYTANLASFLVERRKPSGTIQSVQEAVIAHAPICLQADTALDDYISEKYPAAVLIHRSSQRDVFASLRKDECVVAVVPQNSYDTYSRDEDVNGDCSLSWVGRVERFVPSGLTTAVDSGTLCTSLVTHVLDYHLLQIQTDGFLERAWESHLERVGTQNCVQEQGVSAETNGDSETFSLSIQDLAGIFIVHGILSSTALLVGVVKFFMKRRTPAKDDDVQRPSTVCAESGNEMEGSILVDTSSNVQQPFTEATEDEEHFPT